MRVAVLDGDWADVDEVAADTAAWLSYFTERYGLWAHGDEFLAVHLGPPRGMEYDGATTSVRAGDRARGVPQLVRRGVKPARASDGWVDEAMATWATASRRARRRAICGRRAGPGRAPEPALPAPSLEPPHAPGGVRSRWAPAVGVGAHGGRGGAAAFCPRRLAQGAFRWSRREHGRPGRPPGGWCGRDLAPWWDRYVHGAVPSSGAELMVSK